MGELKKSFFEAMSEGSKIISNIFQDSADKDTDDKEMPASNTSLDIRKNCTLNELIDFYFDMKKQYARIAKCKVIVDDLSKYNLSYNYKIRQFFLLNDSNVFYADDEKKRIVGQKVLTLCVDEEIKKYLGAKENAEFIF